MRYGVQSGFTENKVDVHHVPVDDNHSFYVPGMRIGVMGNLQLGRCFSLRAMPGGGFLGRNWEPGSSVHAGLQYAEYRVESVCGEIPVDVKFHPFSMGEVQPYLTLGLSYGYDFATLHRDLLGHQFRSLVQMVHKENQALRWVSA